MPLSHRWKGLYLIEQPKKPPLADLRSRARHLQTLTRVLLRLPGVGAGNSLLASSCVHRYPRAIKMLICNQEVVSSNLTVGSQI
jgi:hypothetical protein